VGLLFGSKLKTEFPEEVFWYHGKLPLTGLFLGEIYIAKRGKFLASIIGRLPIKAR
jgi:hypothetical protein